MKSIRRALILYLLLSSIGINGQIAFDKTLVNLGRLENFDFVTINIPYTNKSTKPQSATIIYPGEVLVIKLSENISYPGEADTLKISVFPESLGKFNENFSIAFSSDSVYRFSIEANIYSFSQRYSSMLGKAGLNESKEITFIIMDNITERNIPFAKVFLTNNTTGKSYIGYSDEYGVLKNNIKEGSYNVFCLTDGYKYQVNGIRIDPDRNLAAIILEKEADKSLNLQTNQIKSEMEAALALGDTNLAIALKNSSNENRNKEVIKENQTSDLAIIKVSNEVQAATQEKSLIEEITSPTEIKKRDRKPLNIIMLIDNSSSMGQSYKITTLKSSIKTLIENYNPEDRIAILTFNDKVQQLIPSTKVTNKLEIIAKIDEIENSGNTDGEGGVHTAMEIMKTISTEDALNMIILATDGQIAKSVFAENKIIYDIGQMNEKGILFSVMGYSKNEMANRKMQRLADAGGGLFLNMAQFKDDYKNILVDEIYNTLLKIDR
ncbi:MAG: vWA domain-containing protein [Chitinophagales bacterium]